MFSIKGFVAIVCLVAVFYRVQMRVGDAHLQQWVEGGDENLDDEGDDDDDSDDEEKHCDVSGLLIFDVGEKTDG